MSEQGLLDRCRVVPVVVLDHPDQALPLGKALLAGGIDVIEITLRTDAGLEAIRQLSSLPEMLVGAGSVLVSDQVDQVVRCGRPVRRQPRPLGRCRAALPGPGCARAPRSGHGERPDDRVGLGLDEVKFFPAGLLGGPAAIRALAAPFTRMSFMPSGGVNPDNMGEYLAVPAVRAVSGSWMVDPELLRAGRWDEVTARSAAAVAQAG